MITNRIVGSLLLAASVFATVPLYAEVCVETFSPLDAYYHQCIETRAVIQNSPRSQELRALIENFKYNSEKILLPPPPQIITIESYELDLD